MTAPDRKKVLILTYYWPPSGGAGVQRWLKFTKYLREFNYEPIIYTADDPEYPSVDNSLYKDLPENLTVLKTRVWEPYKLYKWFTLQEKGYRINTGFLNKDKKKGLTERISVWIRGNLFIPDARKYWIKPSVKYLLEYLRNNPVDLIVSTGPPHSLHLIALKIKERLKIPWLADFRDPWTKIDYYEDLKLSPSSDRKHHNMEKKVMEGASAVTVVSKHMKQQFEKMGFTHVHVVPNGFDRDDFLIPAEPPDENFSITHLGTIVPSRNPETFWKVLSELVEENEEFARDLEVKLAGACDFSVSESIEVLNLGKWIKKIDYIPHQEAIKILKRSRVLLLLINDTPNAIGILTGKFFEYLSSGRPIFAIGPTEGEAGQVLKETGTGYIADFSDHEGMKKLILELYDKFNKEDLNISAKNIFKYSRKSLTEEITGIFTDILKTK